MAHHDILTKCVGEKPVLGGIKMDVARIILTIVFIAICVFLTIIILLQEGKSAGLGAIAGAAETYWGKNKGRSMEGIMIKLTRIAVIGFLVIAAILNIGSFG